MSEEDPTLDQHLTVRGGQHVTQQFLQFLHPPWAGVHACFAMSSVFAVVWGFVRQKFTPNLTNPFLDPIFDVEPVFEVRFDSK